MEEERDLLTVLSKERNNFQNLLRSFKKLEKLQLEPESNLRHIKNELKKIKEKTEASTLIEPLKEKILERYEAINIHVPEWEESARKSFGHNLEVALNEVGLKLNGNYSRLEVLLYTLDVDLDNLKVIIWFGNKQEKVVTCNLNPEEVTKKLLLAYNKMKKVYLTDEDFIAKLYKAYNYVSLKKNVKTGNKVRLTDVMDEFVFLLQGRNFLLNPSKSNFKGYDRIQFAYDLYRLSSRQFEGKTLNLITASRAYTKSRMDFIWIPSNENGNGDFISHISFT